MKTKDLAFLDALLLVSNSESPRPGAEAAALVPEKEKESIKDLLLAMPPSGEDSDFERIPDCGRDCDSAFFIGHQ